PPVRLASLRYRDPRPRLGRVGRRSAVATQWHVCLRHLRPPPGLPVSGARPVRRKAAVLYRPPRAVRLRQRAVGSRLPSRRIALAGPARAAEAVCLRLHTRAARAARRDPQIARRALAAL